MAEPVKRKYDSTRRQAQARQTQTAIATAARGLFVDRGYAATSIRDIADASSVSVQTIYNLFSGGKPAIFQRVVDMAIVGDDEPIALEERADVRTVFEESDPRAVIHAWVSFAVDIFVRMMPVYPAMQEAANIEPAIAARRHQNYIEDRWATMRRVAAHLKELKALPRGMTVDRAADALFAWGSVETTIALLGERGWTADEYVRWTTDMFCRVFEID